MEFLSCVQNFKIDPSDLLPLYEKRQRVIIRLAID